MDTKQPVKKITTITQLTDILDAFVEQLDALDETHETNLQRLETKFMAALREGLSSGAAITDKRNIAAKPTEVNDTPLSLQAVINEVGYTGQLFNRLFERLRFHACYRNLSRDRLDIFLQAHPNEFYRSKVGNSELWYSRTNQVQIAPHVVPPSNLMPPVRPAAVVKEVFEDLATQLKEEIKQGPPPAPVEEPVETEDVVLAQVTQQLTALGIDLHSGGLKFEVLPDYSEGETKLRYRAYVWANTVTVAGKRYFGRLAGKTRSTVASAAKSLLAVVKVWGEQEAQAPAKHTSPAQPKLDFNQLEYALNTGPASSEELVKRYSANHNYDGITASDWDLAFQRHPKEFEQITTGGVAGRNVQKRWARTSRKASEGQKPITKELLIHLVGPGATLDHVVNSSVAQHPTYREWLPSDWEDAMRFTFADEFYAVLSAGREIWYSRTVAKRIGSSRPAVPVPPPLPITHPDNSAFEKVFDEKVAAVTESPLTQPRTMSADEAAQETEVDKLFAAAAERAKAADSDRFSKPS